MTWLGGGEEVKGSWNLFAASGTFMQVWSKSRTNLKLQGKKNKTKTQFWQKKVKFMIGWGRRRGQVDIADWMVTDGWVHSITQVASSIIANQSSWIVANSLKNKIKMKVTTKWETGSWTGSWARNKIKVQSAQKNTSSSARVQNVKWDKFCLWVKTEGQTKGHL